MTTIPDDLVSPRKACEILSVNISTLYRWILAGKLRSWRRAGTRYRVSLADVRALLEPVMPRPRPTREELGLPASKRALAARARHTQEVLRRAGYKIDLGSEMPEPAA